jgi:hypothetical protein
MFQLYISNIILEFSFVCVMYDPILLVSKVQLFFRILHIRSTIRLVKLVVSCLIVTLYML